ncbi:MAG: hypothetical protein HKL84_02330 [Acidimicrobiaceae bacterium]|nr:hypothetical protein [Acidimicrobiaceae bacterium]
MSRPNVFLVLCFSVGTVLSARAISYRDRQISVQISPNLGFLSLGVIWLLVSGWLVDYNLQQFGLVRASGLVCQLVLFPPLAMIDLAVRKVPTLLVRTGSIWIILILVMSQEFAALPRAVLSVILFVGPLMLVNVIQPHAIGEGDIRLGTFIGPLLCIDHSPMVIPAVLAISSIMAFVAASGARLIIARRISSVPLVPFILAAVVLVELSPRWWLVH